MRKFILIFILSIATSQLFSQINQYMENVVLIQSKDKSLSGSGFLYNTGNNLYLMTAKHVLLTQDNNLLLGDFLFQSYPHNAQKENSIEYSINLKEAFAQKKARFGAEFDIIAVQIGTITNNMVSYFNFVTKEPTLDKINEFSLNECVLNIDSINIGDEVFMIGYPKSLEHTNYNIFDFNRPISRKGSIAGKDYAHNTILVDCPAYGGNSGGPILIKKGKNLKMIGLVSSYVPYYDYWINPVTKITNTETVNSGLTVVIPFYWIIKDLYNKTLWE